MTFLRTAKKALGALLGAATGVAVIQALELFGLTVDPAIADAAAVLLAALGAYLAPKNDQSTEILDDVE